MIVLSNDLSWHRLAVAYRDSTIGHTSEPECSLGNSKEVPYICVRCSDQRLRPDPTHLSGSIPMSIGLSTTIKEMEVSESDVAGSIPTKVGLLPALELLCLYNHQLTGAIPTKIGRLSGLRWLALAVA